MKELKEKYQIIWAECLVEAIEKGENTNHAVALYSERVLPETFDQGYLRGCAEKRLKESINNSDFLKSVIQTEKP